MKYTGFHARNFEAQVEKALAVVQTILDTNRAPKLAADIQEHEYDDKFALSGFLTNTAIASLWNIFERMGLTPDMLQELCQEAQTEKRAVTMRFQAEDTCSFLKETTVDVVTFETQHETETTSTSASFFTTSSKESTKNKVISKVKEYHWKIGMNYTLTIFAGPNPNKNTIQLQARSSSTTVVTTGTKEAIFPDKTIHSPHDINITWFFQQLKQTTPKKDDAAAVVGPTCNFSIDRSLDECKTPVRNPDVKAALKFFQAVSQWSTHVSNHFKRRIERQILGKHNPAAPGTKPRNDGLANLSTRDVFCPVLPLLEDPEGRDMPGTATRQENARSLLVITSPSTNATSPLLSLGDINKFLNEQVRSLDAALTDLSKTFAPQQLMKLITMQEASLTMLCLANVALFNNFYNSIYYIEDMLKKQLIAAIGKEVQPKDFNEYMKFHFGNLFDEQFAPKPFCYAIRQPKAFPDGLLTIEPPTEGAEPIQTMVRHLPADDDASSITGPLKIPINAATTIDMTGDRYLHGWIQHRFESSSPNPAPFQLSARARQFSSFLLMVGVMAGPNQFNPKEAIILQNKDEVLIPLLLNELPTAKDFRDAISSLSPEQQRFAKAFRGMQLESSVFGVCVVQLKPQLEVLLGVPAGALTKEIRLTQDLMSLFVDYQIPSDLLSFDGDVSTSTRSETIEAVRGHVKSVMDVIEEAKESQLKEEAQKASMNVLRMTAEEDEEIDFGGGMSFFAEVDECMAASDYAGSTMSKAKASPLTSQPMTRRIMSARVSPPAQSSQAPPITDANQIAVSPRQATNGLDFTIIPRQLDSKFEKFDEDNSLRATIIKAGKNWSRRRQENLLKGMKSAFLSADDTKSETNKAFDLLDALSRSGSLPIQCAELHVVVAVTHCFENDVMGTVVQDNINPIEKVERSSLMVASTIHGVEDVGDMIRAETETRRLSASFPALFPPLG